MSNLDVFFDIVSKDQDIVHVNHNNASVDQVLKYMVHKVLKCSRRVRKSKKHNSRFVKSLVCAECSLPFVTFLDANIVVTPTNIHLGEDFQQ